MDNAITIAKRQKSDKYNDLVNVLCRRFPDNDVRFRAMVMDVMRIIRHQLSRYSARFNPRHMHRG